MAYAEFLAGMAFNNASLGYVHAMAHQLGGFYNLPHGVCNAILLPAVCEFNLIAAASGSATSRWPSARTSTACRRSTRRQGDRGHPQAVEVDRHPRRPDGARREGGRPSHDGREREEGRLSAHEPPHRHAPAGGRDLQGCDVARTAGRGRGTPRASSPPAPVLPSDAPARPRARHVALPRRSRAAASVARTVSRRPVRRGSRAPVLTDASDGSTRRRSGRHEHRHGAARRRAPDRRRARATTCGPGSGAHGTGARSARILLRGGARRRAPLAYPCSETPEHGCSP